MSVRALSVMFLSLALLMPAAHEASASGRGTRAPRSARAPSQAKDQARTRARVATPASRAKGPQASQGKRLHQRLFGMNGARSRKTTKGKQVSPLAKRQLVRDRQAAVKGSLARGELLAASRIATASLTHENGKFVKGQIKNPTIRERFALWRMSRQVAKASRKAAKQRSKAGDAQGARDAMQSLAQLEKGGRMGVIARWRNARVARKTFKNSVKASRKAMKDGDMQTARDLQNFAFDLRGDSRLTRSRARTLMADSIKLARTYAKQGNPNATWQALQMAEEFSGIAQKTFNTKRAEKIVNQSFAEAGRILMKEAKADYKARRFDDSAIKVAELRAIQAQVPDAKMSKKTLSTQTALTRKLGPRVADKAGLFSDALSKREVADMASDDADRRSAAKGVKDSKNSEQIMLSNSSH